MSKGSDEVPSSPLQAALSARDKANPKPLAKFYPENTPPTFEPQPLTNGRHEAFVQLVAKGKSQSEAYSSVYGTSGSVSGVCASQLLKRPEVRGRLQELRVEAVDDTVLDIREALQFCAETVRTPFSQLTADSHLLQSIKTTTVLQPGPDGKPVPIEMHEYKVPDKMKAIDMTAKLLGWVKSEGDINIHNNTLIQVGEMSW